jgi:hypothetical protein
MKTFHELCGSCFCKEIGRMILGKRGDEVMRNIYLMQVEEVKTGFFDDEEKLNCYDF